MKIKQLHLQNYGRFEDLTIDFAPTAERTSNVTIIVGNNGAGKSQILEALATGLSWFVNEILHETGGKIIRSKEDSQYLKFPYEGEFIKQSSIKNDSDKAILKVSLTSMGLRGFIEIDSSRKDELEMSSQGNHNQISELISQYIKGDKNESTDRKNLPLISFYTIDRNVQVKEIIAGYSFSYTPKYAYNNTLNAGSNYDDFFQWFRDNEDIENEKTNNQIAKNAELDEMIKKKSRLYHLLNFQEQVGIDDFDGDRLYHSRMSEVSEEIEAIQSYLNHMNIRHGLFNKVDSDEKISALKNVRQAIEYFTDFKNPRIRRQGIPTMIVEKDGEELDVNQLSQGEKSLLALVGDIARRLAILNPSLDNPLEGEGVVMIDEVDLHLHPKWQHDLVDKLVRTFPNVQFILTTHSPHIISDRSDILVYALDNGELTQVPNIYGEDVNTVLTKVFDVDIRDSKVQKKFDNIYALISDNQLTKAETTLQTLEQDLPTSNLELLRCRLHLTQRKLANTQATSTQNQTQSTELAE